MLNIQESQALGLVKRTVQNLLLLHKIFFRIGYQHCATKCSRRWFYGALNSPRALLIFVNKVQVQCKKQKIEGKEIGDFANAASHD